MIVLREKKPKVEHDAEVPTVDSVDEAVHLKGMILDGYFKTPAQRDAANGLNEAFFVSFLRKSHMDNLKRDIDALKKAVGNDYNPLKRALARVKAFRGQNPAWNTR